MQDASARAGSYGATAFVAAAEGGLAGPQRLHDGAAEIVLTIDAAWIAALDEKQGGRAVDHDAAHVLGTANPGPLFNLETQAAKARDLLPQTRRIFFTLATVREAEGCCAVHPVRHHH